MNRHKDNYSDGARSKKDHPRHYSFKGRKLSTPDRFGVKEKDFYRNIRVIQKNLVHVIGLPETLSKANIASREFFGKYGNVQKYSLYPITRTGNKNKVYSYTCYITYTNEIEASLAIIALDGKTIDDRLLKLSFGTTKYCSHFTKDIDCPNIKECLYLHQWQKQNEILVQQQTKSIYKSQWKVALHILKQQLDAILKQKYSNDEQSDFPSINQALYTLVDHKIIDQETLQQKLTQIDPSKKLDYNSVHRKSVSSISTTISNHKFQAVEEPIKNYSAQNLIQKYLSRSLLVRKNHQHQRSIVLQGELDFGYMNKIKECLCRQIVFSAFSI